MNETESTVELVVIRPKWTAPSQSRITLPTPRSPGFIFTQRQVSERVQHWNFDWELNREISRKRA